MLRFLLLLCSVLIAAPANAVELREIEVRTGTEGLSPVQLSLTNSGAEMLSCIGELAHWYSTEVARIKAGSTARVELWFDPQTGTYALLNDRDENLPIESLWCGRAGKAYETRARVALDRSLNRTPEALDLNCNSDTDPVRCQ